MSDPLQQLAQLGSCWCHQCHHNRGEWVQFMIVCPTCGCKRCPHATHHEHGCTGSNDSGQHGSVYGDYSVDPEGAAETAKLLDELDPEEGRAERLAAFRRKHNL